MAPNLNELWDDAEATLADVIAEARRIMGEGRQLRQRNRDLIAENSSLQHRLDKSEQGWEEHFRLEEQWGEAQKELAELVLEVRRLKSRWRWLWMVWRSGGV